MDISAFTELLKGWLILKKYGCLLFHSFYCLLLSGCTDAVIKPTQQRRAALRQRFDAGTLADLIYSNAKFDDMMTKVPSASVIKYTGFPPSTAATAPYT